MKGKSKWRVAALAATAAVLVLMFFAFVPAGVAQAAEEQSGEEQLSQNIEEVLDGLDLSALQKYLDEHSESYRFNFGDNAGEIVRYLINGNAGVDYGGYINELLSVVFSDVIGLLPAFAEAVAVGLLCTVFAGADGMLGKSTSRVVKLACY